MLHWESWSSVGARPPADWQFCKNVGKFYRCNFQLTMLRQLAHDDVQLQIPARAPRAKFLFSFRLHQIRASRKRVVENSSCLQVQEVVEIVCCCTMFMARTPQNECHVHGFFFFLSFCQTGVLWQTPSVWTKHLCTVKGQGLSLSVQLRSFSHIFVGRSKRQWFCSLPQSCKIILYLTENLIDFVVQNGLF